MSIDAQHRFEVHFAGKIHHVADKTEPIILIDIAPITVDECRLAPFVSARNCLSSHWLPTFLFFSCCPLGLALGGCEAAGVPPPLLEKLEEVNSLTNRHYNTGVSVRNVTIRLLFRGMNVIRTGRKMIKFICVAALIIASFTLANAQEAKRLRITEVKNTAVAAAAPRECFAAFRTFFEYLQKSEPDIVRDQQAQKRWLTESFRKALAQKVATFSSPAESPDYPSNNTFIGAWDAPSTFSIISSRRYGNRAILDVLYKWGPKTNYPGNERIVSFIFVLEDGAWKLDDIYNFREKFGQAESLNQYLLDK